MSASCAIFVQRELGGELVASMGVEFQPLGGAPRLELCGPKDGAVDATTLCLKAAFAMFGGSLPLAEGFVKNATVFHQGLDRSEVFGQVPDHPCGLNLSVHCHGHPSRKVV